MRKKNSIARDFAIDKSLTKPNQKYKSNNGFDKENDFEPKQKDCGTFHPRRRRI